MSIREYGDPGEYVPLAMSLAKEAMARFDKKASVMDHDLFGEAMLGLVLAAKDFDPSLQSFATWAHYKIKGRLATYMEKEGNYRKKRGRLSLAIVQRESEPAEFDDVDVADVREMIDHIGGKEADVIKARLEGLTLQDVGKRFGFTRERARQLEYCGIEMIRQRMGLKRGDVWA